jgi:hypothetical protein
MMRPLSTFKRTVYYSHFWYSRFAYSPISRLNGNLLNEEVDCHRRYLRLLSLFFETIYIPRTHLVTHLFNGQDDIILRVLNTKDVKYLCEIGTISISLFPGTDAKQDFDRITSRSRYAPDIFYPKPPFLAHIPSSRECSVDTFKESSSNLVTFPAYANTLSIVSPSLSSTAATLISRSTIKDVPFFHEKFVRDLPSSVDNTFVEKLWRDTNSIYLTTGAPELSSMIAYFNEQIESTDFRFTAPITSNRLSRLIDRYWLVPTDRYLYNPSALLMFIMQFLSERELKAFLFADIEDSHSFLHDERSFGAAAAFRAAYATIVEEISAFELANQMPKSDLSLQTIAALFSKVLDGKFSSNLDLVRGLLTDAGTIANAASLPGGGSTFAIAAKSGINTLAEPFRRLRRRVAHPAIALYMNLLRDKLKDASIQ